MRGYADAYLGPDQALVLLVRTGLAPAIGGGRASGESRGGAAAGCERAAEPAAAGAPACPLADARRCRRATAHLRQRADPHAVERTLAHHASACRFAVHTALLGFSLGGCAFHAAWRCDHGALGTTADHGVARPIGTALPLPGGRDSTLDVLQSTGSDVAETLKLLGQQVAHETYCPPQRFIDLLEVFERDEKAPASLFERAFARAFFGSGPRSTRSSASRRPTS